MSFDPTNLNQKPAPKTYQSSIRTYQLMRLVMDSFNSPNIKDYAEKIVANWPKIDETREVNPEVIWELKEIEKEIWETKMMYRKLMEELTAKMFAIRFLLLTNWIVFFCSIICLFIHVNQGADLTFTIINSYFFLAVVSAFAWFITWAKWFEYIPLDDDDARMKLNKEYEKLKSELKPSYTGAELIQERKKVIDLFLNDFLAMKRKCYDLEDRRYMLKYKAGYPIYLYFLCAFIFFLVGTIMREGIERGASFVGVISTVIWSVALLPFIMQTF